MEPERHIGATLQHLIDRRLTTAEEICDITGRSRTTVHEVLHGNRDLRSDDLQRLLNSSNEVMAAAVMEALVCGAPVTVSWGTVVASRASVSDLRSAALALVDAGVRLARQTSSDRLTHRQRSELTIDLAETQSLLARFRMLLPALPVRHQAI